MQKCNKIYWMQDNNEVNCKYILHTEGNVFLKKKFIRQFNAKVSNKNSLCSNSLENPI